MASKKDTQNVGFRLPTGLLKTIDESAKSNHRDRTGEIIHALEEYYKNESERQEIYDIIKEITTKIDSLDNEVKHLKKG